VTDATVEIGEQGGRAVSDDGGFEVGACEIADGFDGTPCGFDEDFDFAFETANGNSGSQVAGDAAELGRTFSSKWSRYLGNCATEARADQRRKMVPDAGPTGRRPRLWRDFRC